MRVTHFGPVRFRESTTKDFVRRLKNRRLIKSLTLDFCLNNSSDGCQLLKFTFTIKFYEEFMRFIIGLALSLSILCSQANASVVFEGYYKVSQFNNHVGFIIIKHELEPKTNNYIIQTYLRLAKKNFDMTETLKTISDSNMKPVKYSYTALDKKRSKTIEGSMNIDAKTKKEVLSVLAVEDGNKLAVSVPYEKGVFFSSALYPMMLRGEKGLKTGLDFEFSALAEEAAQVHTGTTKIAKSRVTKDTLQLLKAENNFAGSSYEVLLTDQGEIVSTNDKKTGIKTELVRNKEEAIQDIKVNNKTIEQIFGSLPEGKTNFLNVKK